jgi:uroporphyrinogen-III synthase
MNRLILTRPQEDSAHLASRLLPLEIYCLIEPLLTISPRPFELPKKHLSAIVLTSRHAANMLGKVTPDEWDRDTPVICVGKASAHATESAGATNIINAAGDAHALIECVKLNVLPKSGLIVHLRGVDSRGAVSSELHRAGFECCDIIAYEAVAARQLTENTINALKTSAIDGVLFFSPRSAQIFSQLVAAIQLGTHVTGIHAYCLSHAVAGRLADLNMNHVIADQPNLNSLIAKLQENTLS